MDSISCSLYPLNIIAFLLYNANAPDLEQMLAPMLIIPLRKILAVMGPSALLTRQR
ncbi:hypothetical protein D3C76_1833630 [compost metagenome]